MFNWNLRNYWDGFQYELNLHHFPGQPEMQPDLPMECIYRRPLPPYILPIEGPNMQPNNENEEPNHVLIFKKRSYIASAVFILATVLQWVLFALFVKKQHAFELPGFLCLILAFSALMFLTFFQWLTSKLWVISIFAVILVETVAWGVVLMLIARSPLNILAAVAPAEILQVLCHVMGAWLPKIVLPGEITLAMFLVLFVAGGIISLTLLIVTDQPIYHTIYYCMIGIVTIPMSMYYAQLIHGRRRFMHMKEFLSCAASIFIHFVLFFIVFYHIIWVRKW